MATYTYNFNFFYKNTIIIFNPTITLNFGVLGTTEISSSDCTALIFSSSLVQYIFTVSFETNTILIQDIFDASIHINNETIEFTANYNITDYFITNDTTYNTGTTLDDWCIPWQFMLERCCNANYLDIPEGQSYNQLFKRQEFDEGNLSNYGSFAYDYLNGNIIYYDDSKRMTKYSDLALFEFVNSSGGGGSVTEYYTLQYATVKIDNNSNYDINISYYSNYTTSFSDSNYTTTVSNNASHSLNNGNVVNCSSTNSAGFFVNVNINNTIIITSINISVTSNDNDFSNLTEYTTTYSLINTLSSFSIYELVSKFLESNGFKTDSLTTDTISVIFTLTT